MLSVSRIILLYHRLILHLIYSKASLLSRDTKGSNSQKALTCSYTLHMLKRKAVFVTLQSFNVLFVEVSGERFQAYLRSILIDNIVTTLQ